jgi:hypothetical protein
MSFTDTRVLLTTVLDSVTGLSGHQFRPSTITTGSAWPKFEQAIRGGGDAWGATWTVTVILGQDEQAAATLLDQVFDELLDEIESTGTAYVESPAVVVPYQVSGTQMQALQLAVTSE